MQPSDASHARHPCRPNLATVPLCALITVVALGFAGCRSSTPPHATEAAAPASVGHAAIASASDPVVTTVQNWPDVHSYAEPDRFVTRHFELDLTADFAEQRLRGVVTLDVDRLDPGANELVLDTRDLAIRFNSRFGGMAFAKK